MVTPDPLRRARIEKVTAKIDRDQGSQFLRLPNPATTQYLGTGSLLYVVRLSPKGTA